MKKCSMLVLSLLAVMQLWAYGMGQYEKIFVDPARNNRQIRTWIYYPIDQNNPLSTFPYIVYGHGWNGSCESYGAVTSGVVNLGWIIAYPRTEESMFGYNTVNLAQDMVFLKNAVYMETLNLSSPIYSKVDTLAIVGGYSMGGACAVAAASMEPSYASLVTLAAAPITWLNLYPASINMATNVTMPSLTYSGSADNTAPPDENQEPIYYNLASNFKCFVSFTGQGHINFYNNSLIYAILEPWLDYLKTGSVYYIDQFEALLGSYPASALTWQRVDNLVVELDIPQNVLINSDGNILEISWGSILEAHTYKVYASDNPYTGFTEVTGQGSFSTSNRVSWTTTNPSPRQFYYIKAFR